MNAELASLASLQKLDREIAALKTEIAGLPRLHQQIEAKLASAKKRVEDAKAAIKANELARRNYEHEIQGENNKIVKFREQSSSVKTNEQYRALLNEIEHAEKHIRALEDKILDSMVDMEVHQTELKTAEAALKADSVVIEKEKADAAARTAETEKLMTERLEQRKQLRATVSDSMLAHYDRLLKARGTALAEARGQRCMGCQVMLRPQIWEEVKNGEAVHTCDGCSRILFYDPASAEQSAPATANAPTVEREWLFVPNMGTRGAFVVLVNHPQKNTTMMKSWDAETGEALDRKVEKNNTYQHAFAELISAGRNLFVDEPNIEERYKDQLPPEFVTELRHQLPTAAPDPGAIAGQTS